MNNEESGMDIKIEKLAKLVPRLVLHCMRIPYERATAQLILTPPAPYNEVLIQKPKGKKKGSVMLLEVALAVA